MCRYNTQTCRVEVVSKKSACRYHARGCSYDFTALAPDGLCPEVYHNVYPYCLSMIYGGRMDTDILVRCPSAQAEVVVRVYPKPLPWYLRPAGFMRSVLNVFFPLEIIRQLAFIRVQSVQGPCRQKHAAGQIYEFPLGPRFFSYYCSRAAYFFEKRGTRIKSSSHLCPAFFDACFPLLGYFLKNRYFPWGEEGEHNRLQCADHQAGIEIKCLT